MSRSRAVSRLALGLVAASVLAGCAEQRIRNESTEQLHRGEYEAALRTLQGGVSRYPESALLRAGLDQAREAAIERLVANANENVAAQEFDRAEGELQRALALDPRNDRVRKLQADLLNERRASKAAGKAEALLAAGKRQEALHVVDAALLLAPRHAELLALRQRLQNELGLDGVSTRRALAEMRPITLDFRGASLSVVLDAVTRFSGVNFILDRDVRQDARTTIYLRSARVEDAIELVATASNLSSRIIDPQTVLLYPNTPEKQREHQEQVIRVFHLSNVDAKSAAAMLRNVLRLKDPYVDEHSNIVVLRESPNIIAIAERLIALQDAGEPEVMMEVEVLEITKTRLTQLGLNFPDSITFTPLDPTGAVSGLTANNLRSLNSNRVGVNVGSLILNLHSDSGDINILANPRIRAKNKEKARILIGDKVPVFTSTSTATGFVSESVNYLDVGLKLDVEPTISLDDEVSLKLGLEVSNITNQVSTTNGSLAYQIGTRMASTTLRLRDGETQLLGGLISNEDRASANKLPGLGDLPVAGRLFSSHTDNYARTELVLAITPHIVRSTAKPDLAQSEMWIGTENSTRLRPPPGRTMVTAAQHTAAVSLAPTAAPGRPEQEQVATNAPVALVPIRATIDAPASAKVGEAILVTLNMESTNPVHALPLEIAFPPDKLEAVEVSEGPFIKQGRLDASFSHAINPGKVIVGVMRNDPAGATGKGTVVTVRFKARTAGDAVITLLSSKPIGLSGPLVMGPLPSTKVEIK
jgi:general secretion pathway protein D